MPVLLFGLFELYDLLVDVAIDKQPPETGLANHFNLGSYHHGLCHFAFSSTQHCLFKLIGLMVNRSLVLACKGENTVRWMMYIVAPSRVRLCLLLSIFVVAVLGCSTF